MFLFFLRAKVLFTHKPTPSPKTSKAARLEETAIMIDLFFSKNPASTYTSYTEFTRLTTTVDSGWLLLLTKYDAAPSPCSTLTYAFPYAVVTLVVLRVSILLVFL
jgi:hypothetical protein